MKREAAALVERELAAVMAVLPLRGIDADARPHGDLDYLVPKGFAVRACRLVADAASAKGWGVLLFKDIGYLASVVLGRVVPGAIESVKVDFFSGLEWYGAGGASVSDRLFYGVLPAAFAPERRAALAGVVTFLQKAMTAGRLSERDLTRVRRAGASGAYIEEVARMLGLPVTVAEAERGRLSGAAKWRLRAASAGVRGWAALARWIPQVVAAHLRFKLGLGTGSGFLLAFAGLDGCGKSTQYERLLAAYEWAGVRSVTQVHLLPGWIPLPHQLVRRKVTVENYTRPYAEAPVRSSTSAFIRLTYYLVAFFVSRVVLRVAVARGTVVLMDRSFMDFVADLARSRIPHRMLPRLLMRVCAPPGTIVFMDARPATVVMRKNELSLGKAEELRGRYRIAAAEIGMLTVDGEGSCEEVSSAVLGCVDAGFRRVIAKAVAA